MGDNVEIEKVQNPGGKKEESNSFDDFKKSKDSALKSLSKKAATAALVVNLALGGGGCATSRGPTEQEKVPVDSDTIEEVFEKDESKVELVYKTYEPGIGKNNEYQINISEGIIEKISELGSNEGEIKEYPIFRVKDDVYLNRVEQLREMADFVADQEVREEKGLGYYSFKFGNSNIHIGRDSNICDIYFEEPIEIPSLGINLSDRASLEKAMEQIDTQFFNIGSKHRLDSVVKEQGFYRVNFTRLLDGVDVDVIDRTSVSLLVSEDGKIKGGKLWLAEFEKVDEIKLVSGSEFAENITKKEYPKAIINELPFYDIAYSYRGTQFAPYSLDDFLRYDQDNGIINLKEVELVFYFFENNKLVLPVFRLSGDGSISAKGAREGYDTNYEIIASAMSLEHIKDYKVE